MEYNAASIAIRSSPIDGFRCRIAAKWKLEAPVSASVADHRTSASEEAPSVTDSLSTTHTAVPGLPVLRMADGDAA
jgi:hypothetical protein